MCRSMQAAPTDHLGNHRGMAAQIRLLMKDIVTRGKTKQEFDTLQSQINPFPHNTLDIIVWMIENEQKAEAVKAVTALAGSSESA
ncbi:MAG: sensor histidine kinase [Eisenbergiella sp.]